ncbi:MAG: hypothetical protein FRX49_13619, partial [Trebouxia sp. A1-2]
MGIPIPKISIDVRAGAGFGFAAAVVGGGIRHVHVAQQQQHIQALQVSEASALERAAAAERSNAQLTEEAQDQQRTRDLAENQAEEQRDNVKQQWATAQAEWSKSLEQAQLSHDSLMQSLQRQLHDALEGRTAAE